MTETKIDPRTNMPAVPEGYTWKVKIRWGESYAHPTAAVTLKKGFSTLAYKEVQLAEMDQRDLDAGRSDHYRKYPLIRIKPEDYYMAIQSIAEEVLEQNKKRLEEDAFYKSYLQAKKRFSGKYPPKNLGSV